jgi:DNA (cytosine-5)-methyltransferase 1
VSAVFRVLSLFAGIGGFDLGLERTGGFKTVAFCEIDPFCRKVLAKHWPSVPCYEDVRTLTANVLERDGIVVDVICGGFPCQDISTAGKQGGLEADRSGLWFQYLRLVGELRPDFIIVENVTNLLRGPSERPGEWFGVVLGGLAEIGYDAVWDCIPASAIGAPHIRDRVWLIAQPQHPDAVCKRQHRAAGDLRAAELRHEQGGNAEPLRAALADANCAGRSRPGPAQPKGRRRDLVAAGRSSSLADAHSEPLERPAIAREERDPWQAEPDFCRVVDGLSDGLDDERRFAVSALGNAVVPQIPYLIGRAILAAHNMEPQP